MTNGPTGGVINAAGRFTSCVSKKDYRNTASFGVGTGLASLGKDACNYLLGGKLVCLDGVRCAVGTIIHIEPVGYQKSGFDQIDNDFCVNLLLFPHEIDRFNPSGGKSDKLANWAIVKNDGIQGALIDHDPATMPKPRDPATAPTPYVVTYLFGQPGGPVPYEPNEDKTERLLEEVKQDASGIKRVEVPVLHCEFEGSRIFAVCQAVAPFLDLATGGPGSGACRAAIGWIPLVGDFVCTVIETAVAIALAPLMALAAAAAWAAAGLIDEAAITGPIARQVERGENVIVTGRWVWDGGHSGWNELHATHTLQKVVLPEKHSAGVPAGEARDLVDRWCRLVGEAPPTGRTGQPLVAVMTPDQKATHDRQQRPEHEWAFHPSIDGCEPDDDEHPERPIR